MRTLILCCLVSTWASLYVAAKASISEADILSALVEGEQRIKVQQRKEQSLVGRGLIDSQRGNEESHFEQERGHIFLEATKILVEKNGKEILPELAKFDVDEILAKSLGAPRVKRQTTRCQPDDSSCFNLRNSVFRSITGICNNQFSKELGKNVSPTRRMLGKNSYVDGHDEVRTAVSGLPLPSARLISNIVHDERNRNIFDSRTNHFHMQYGQFIAHDITFMPSSEGPNRMRLDCTSCESGNITSNCMPIPVPSNDNYFPRNGCIRFTRALSGQKGLGPRAQININTHFLDLSLVYGSEECEAASLRSFRNGELKDFNHRGSILPPQAPNDTNCQSRRPNFCFLAGDIRNTLQPGLIPLHAVYIKEHNRIAKLFKAAIPRFTDERIFQETRRIMIARHQHHVYNEYIPKVISEQMRRKFDLIPLPVGHAGGYSESIDPSLSVEFATAAFRFGHSQARTDLPRFNNNGDRVSSAVPLGNNFFYAESLYRNQDGGSDAMLHGMMQQPGLRVDSFFSFPMRNQLFEIRGRRASGVDLAAVNIQRGRDSGVLPYNEYRVAANLSKANSFDDLRDVMDIQNINLLRSVYADVNDIDLYTGMLMERPDGTALLGVTGSHIIAETFSNLKKGDRFFYEFLLDGVRAFTSAELAMIKKSQINKMYCTVTDDMEIVLRDVFNHNSQKILCSSIEQVDIAPFIAGARAISINI